MAKKSNRNSQAPGRSDRKGISFIELFKKFPTEKIAERWLKKIFWNGKPHCPRCGSLNVNMKVKHPTMPHRCREKGCRAYFSVKTGTCMESSKLSYQVWAIAMYLFTTNLKGISSMRLHRELKITQQSAWFVLARLREGIEPALMQFAGPVEVDETYIGGKVDRMSKKRRKEYKEKHPGRGGDGKILIAAIKDKAARKMQVAILPDTSKDTLQTFVLDRTAHGSIVQTDEAGGYKGLDRHDRQHETINHSEDEYVRYVGGNAITTNGVESFWFTVKSAIIGVFHHVSTKHLHRYIGELAGRYNIRDLDTESQLSAIANSMRGKRLRYVDLVAKTVSEKVAEVAEDTEAAAKEQARAFMAMLDAKFPAGEDYIPY